jgi:sulfur carrier protein
MTVVVNGQDRQVPQDTTPRQLVALLGLKIERVAVELNRRLVRSSGYDTPLNERDAVEIVTFVGGG